MSKYVSSPTQQGMGGFNWLTGTVSEILNCGHSYMITGSNGRVYRRNRAHLKPICYNGSSFQNCTYSREGQKAQSWLLSRPQEGQEKGENHVIPDRHSTDIMARAMIFDIPSDNCPSHPFIRHHVSTYSPRSPSYSPHHLSHPGKVLWNPIQRKPHLKAGYDTSQNQLSSDPEMLTGD